jgi:UDP-N-acetylglucosamine 2-epimerase
MSAAMERWNRGLDIRLRFLNIGIEETVIQLDEVAGAGETEASGLEQVEQAIVDLAPNVLLLHGHGPAALAAAVSASKSGVTILRTGAGRRDGEISAIECACDRLASALVVEGEIGHEALLADGLADLVTVADPGADENSMDTLLQALLPRMRGR